MHVLLRIARKLGIAPVDVELSSLLPLSECVSRLQAAISPFTASLIAGPMLGEINGTRLRARKQIFRWRFQAHLEADLIGGGERTCIKCRLTTCWRECGLLPFFVLGQLSLAWFRLPADKAGLMLPYILVGGLIVFCLMLYLTNEEAVAE